MMKNLNLSNKSQLILLNLAKNDGEVIKTSLLSIVSNSYALNSNLDHLKDLGLIIVREEKIVRKTYWISLTEKGHQVAEQLLNAELAAKGSLKKSFFSRQQLIIMFLGSVGKTTVSQIKDKIPGSYDDLKELEGMKLVRSEIDNTAHPSQNWIMLTEKGVRLFEDIKKVEGRIIG